MKTRPLSKFSWLFFGGLFLLIGLAFLAFWTAQMEGFYRDRDFFTYWLGGRMLVQGQNVYNQSLWANNHTIYGSTWLENPFFVYPLYTAVFFIPLGILPIEFASTIWIFLSFVMILIGLIISLSIWKNPIWEKMIFPFAITFILFRPAFVTILNGQLDSFLVLVFAAVLVFLAKGKNTFANLCLPFFLLKPNIGVPIMGLYGIWLVSRFKWKDIIQIIGVSGIFIIIPLFFDRSWISQFIKVSFVKGQDPNLYPTFRGLAGLTCNNQLGCTTTLWVILSMLILGLLVFGVIIRRDTLTAENVLLLSMMTTILITPYLRAYDLIFLFFPIFKILGNYAQKGWSFLKIYTAYFIWIILPIGFIFVAIQLNHDILSVFYTIAVLCVYVFIFLYTKREEDRLIFVH